MESKSSRFCGWQLPPIDATKVSQVGPKSKCTQRNTLNRMKFKTKATEDEEFRHFSDRGKYIDEYRKKHTVACGRINWETNEDIARDKNMDKTPENSKFSKYVDIRLPEKKICLTGLPQLRPPPKHAIRSRAIHETATGSGRFLAGVPHLPHLTLAGATKHVVKREMNRIDGHMNKERSQRSKKQARLPYLKPPEVGLRSGDYTNS